MFLLLFDFLAIVLASIGLDVRLESHAKDEQWVRVVQVEPHLFTLDPKLYFVGVNVQSRGLVPHFF